jgi:hypothetical protein
MGTHWKIGRVAWFAGFLVMVFTVGNLDAASSKTEKSGAYFLLYSWSDRQSNYYFALVPRRNEKAFLGRFAIKFSQRYSLSNLRRSLSKLPSGSLIIWQERRELGLTMPPAVWVDRVVELATSKGVQIELNPTLDEKE